MVSKWLGMDARKSEHSIWIGEKEIQPFIMLTRMKESLRGDIYGN